ncbi:MAG: GAF domain-containing protein [Candidatus Eremiobacteraeota bacterium]|nr:GAF domain-containing protein [Candidatus Eremiobacteraeota bacterium]
MAAGVVANAQAPHESEGWRRFLLTLCALVFVLVLMSVDDVFGFGGRPWFGFWDSTYAETQRPFVIAIEQPLPGGASAQAGIRDGDVFDLRKQSFAAREALLNVLNTKTPMTVVRPSGKAITVHASTVWEVQPLWKLPHHVLLTLTSLWFLGCAFLITLRSWRSRVGRTLAVTLLLWAVPESWDLVTPDPALNLLTFLFWSFCTTLAWLLLIYLTSCFGVRRPWRRVMEWLAYGGAVLTFVPLILRDIGVWTLWYDPLSYPLSDFWGYEGEVVTLAIIVLAVAAVATTPRPERTRAAWIVLPLPLSTGASFLLGYNFSDVVSATWYGTMFLATAQDLCTVLGAATVTYALLKRRVFDFGFILSRTIVVAIVSLVVVASFVLLEWLLGTVVAGVSHATTLVANAALALVIGVSLGYIQKRVDAVVDVTLFRKRHQDERALLNFSKEAAYATNADALLDEAIRIVERHTDARNAAILLDRSGEYSAVRSFGDGATAVVGENDGAILALKTWHRPIDPHHCSTALRGALVLPMLARGRLVGVVLSGERAGGEAYAPDEVEALSQFAHGVGSALDSLAADRGNTQAEVLSVQRAILAELQSLPAKLADAVRGDGA